MTSFYADTITKLKIPPDATILVVCGGEHDRDILMECGFTHVTISNLDERVVGDEFHPFQWFFQDAESLSFADNSFDFVFVHAGLHHCASPIELCSKCTEWRGSQFWCLNPVTAY